MSSDAQPSSNWEAPFPVEDFNLAGSELGFGIQFSSRGPAAGPEPAAPWGAADASAQHRSATLALPVGYW